MEPVVCLNCYDFFLPSPRHKNQIYCMKLQCCRSKKAAWKRIKIKTDPQFSREQHLSNQKWVNNNPSFSQYPHTKKAGWDNTKGDPHNLPSLQKRLALGTQRMKKTI
jgi:hypothetical protein